MTWKSRARQAENKLRTRVVLLTLLTLCVALPVCIYGPRRYSRWEQKRLIGQARTLLQAGDYQKAALSLRRIIELNPANLDASRLFAELADKLETPEAVALRERVSLLAPNSFDDAYALASSALNFNNPAVVQEGFAIMKKTGPDRAETHEIAARMAVNARRFGEARVQFAQALKLDPANERFQLESAVLDVQAPDPAVYNAALQTLERLRGSSTQHLGALRALATIYATHGEIAKSIPLAKELTADPKANFQDRLVYLSILQAARSHDFTSYLSSLQTSAPESPMEVALLTGWMNSHELALLSRDWLKTLPREITRKPPVALKLGETYILLKDWDSLQALTKDPDWGDFDFMRLAFLSRALSEKGDEASSKVPWETAAALASHRLDWLNTLERVAISWGWDGKLEKLLWSIAASSNHPQEALQTLASRYQRIGDTRDLYRALSGLLNQDLNNSHLKNNWTMLSLLLQADPDAAIQSSEEMYQATPTDPHIAATYAFALYMSNRTDDALAVMQKLTPQQLNIPGISAYYGIMLAAIRSPDATKYLDRARGAPLLPEEERLIDKARRSLQDK